MYYFSILVCKDWTWAVFLLYFHHSSKVLEVCRVRENKSYNFFLIVTDIIYELLKFTIPLLSLSDQMTDSTTTRSGWPWATDYGPRYGTDSSRGSTSNSFWSSMGPPSARAVSSTPVARAVSWEDTAGLQRC